MQAAPLHLERLVGFFWLLDAKGDLIGDADAIAFEGNDFFRMIGQDTDVFQAEVDQDLCAYAAFVLHQTLARWRAIKLAARVHVDLRKHAGFGGGFDAKSASGVVQVKKDAPVFFGDRRQGAGD